MRFIPVDDGRFSALLCAVLPSPRLVNRQTGEVKTDPATKLTVYTVGICVLEPGSADVISVTVVGEPKGLRVGHPVRVRNLTAVPWERDGRHGITYRAESIEPVGPTAVPKAA